MRGQVDDGDVSEEQVIQQALSSSNPYNVDMGTGRPVLYLEQGQELIEEPDLELAQSVTTTSNVHEPYVHTQFRQDTLLNRSRPEPREPSRGQRS